MKKTVLITGAAGFLGSHLCEFLLNKNFFVIGVDNLIEMFKGLDKDQETRKLVAVTIVYDQCKKLMSGGIKDFHFLL